MTKTRFEKMILKQMLQRQKEEILSLVSAAGVNEESAVDLGD